MNVGKTKELFRDLEWKKEKKCVGGASPSETTEKMGSFDCFAHVALPQRAF